jgi:hypothetical protein
MRNVNTILVGKSLEKRPPGRQRRWDNDSKVDLREMGYENEMQMHLAQGYVQWHTLALEVLEHLGSLITVLAMV